MINKSPFSTLSLILLFPFFVHGISSTSYEGGFFRDVAFRLYCSGAYIFTDAREHCPGAALSFSDIETIVAEEVANILPLVDESAGVSNTQTPSPVVRIVERVLQPQYFFTNNTVVEKVTSAQAQPAFVPPVASVATNLQAFANIPIPFWNGAGAGGSTQTTVVNNISPLPTGGLLGQVLTINTSGTPEWITPVVGTSSTSTSSGWSLTGNAGTDANVNFIGTTDAQDLVFKTNGTTTGRISANGSRIAFGVGAFANIAASDMIVIGRNAGRGATGTVSNSNFLGLNAGNGATDAAYSNFFGESAGQNATDAAYSNFFGLLAGINAVNANNAVFIGVEAGRNDTVNNSAMGSSSILIGYQTNTGGFPDSIALGALAVNTRSNQFLIGPSYTQFNMRGINYFMPSLQGATGTVLINDGSGNLSWGPSASSTVNIFQNGLNSSSSVVKLGGALTENTNINGGTNSFTINRLINAATPNTNVSFELASNRTLPLTGALSLSFPGFHGFVATTTTGSSQSYAGMMTQNMGSTFLNAGPESFFDAYNIYLANDGNRHVNRLINSSHGVSMSNIVYATNTSTTIRRGLFQLVDDGRAVARAIQTNAGSRAEMELLPGGGFWINTFTATSTTRLDLYPHNGLRFTHTLGANYIFPTTNGASGTLMTMGAGGQLSFVATSSLGISGGSVLTENGLSLSTSTSAIRLGGILDGNTVINQLAHSLTFNANNGTAGMTESRNPGYFAKQATSTNSGRYDGTVNVSSSLAQQFERLASQSASNQMYTQRSVDGSEILEIRHFNYDLGTFAETLEDTTSLGDNTIGRTVSLNWNDSGTLRNVNFGAYIGDTTDGRFRVNVSGASNERSLLQKNDGLYLGILDTDPALPLGGSATGYRMPLARGASSTIITTNASGVTSFQTLTGLLASAGNIGLGTTSPAVKLQVVGDIRVGTTGTNGCIQDFSGGIIGGTCSSDQTLKTDITYIPETSFLSKITSLKPATYKWNELANTTYQYNPDVVNTGLIAQDVQTIFPELIKTDVNNYLQVDYRPLTLYTIEAVKELNTALGDITAPSSTPELFAGSILFKKILGALEWMGVRVEQNIVYVKSIFAETLFSKEVETEKLCISENGERVCITKDDLRQIRALINSSNENTSGSTGGTQSTEGSTQVVEEVVTPEIPVVPEVPQENGEQGDVASSDPVPAA